MPSFTKPTDHINWTDGSPSKITEPSGGKKLLGWISGERPAFQFMNWLFWQLNNWQVYFEAVTDYFLANGSFIDAVVPEQYADINAVMADVGITQGARIYVDADMTINTIQQITKNNVLVEFAPGISVNKGSATTGFQITASGVRLRGGRFAGWNGSGDVAAILIDSGSDYSLIGETRFANNNTDIQDNNGKGATYGIINE